MLFVIAYLAFCFTGWLATIKLFTDTRKRYSVLRGVWIQEGVDLSWCEVIAMALFSLVPIVNISMNILWLDALRQKINRWPLINWPKISLPQFKLPKCPIAIHGKRSQDPKTTS